MSDGPLPDAGYYPDPHHQGRHRWWDGQAWATPATGGTVEAPPPIVAEPAPTPAEPDAYAITSLVLSLSWIFFIGSVLGVVFGHLAMRRIAASEGRETGRGTALLGLVIGYSGIAAGLLLLVLV